VESDPCAEENCRQATPYYVPDGSAIIQLVARGVCTRFHGWDRARITTEITLGKEIDEIEVRRASLNRWSWWRGKRVNRIVSACAGNEAGLPHASWVATDTIHKCP
jgi:hypothetical protein